LLKPNWGFIDSTDTQLSINMEFEMREIEKVKQLTLF